MDVEQRRLHRLRYSNRECGLLVHVLVRRFQFSFLLTLAGAQATQQWYDEIKDYDFERSSGRGTGHFTQVVWRDSRQVGVGRAQAADGKWLVVANYLPAGNFIGRYAENVLPLGDGTVKPDARAPVSDGVTSERDNR